VLALVVVAGRRRRRLRDPVDHDGRQQLVLREHILGITVAVTPFSIFLDEPGGESDGRIGAVVAKSLTPNEIHVTLDDENKHGLTFIVDEKSSTVEVKQHGNVLGTHKFSQQAPEGAPVLTTADQSTADSLAGKAAAQALAAANQMVSQLLSEQD